MQETTKTASKILGKILSKTSCQDSVIESRNDRKKPTQVDTKVKNPFKLTRMSQILAKTDKKLVRFFGQVTH